MLLINWATCDCFMRIIKDNHSILARARRGSLCLHAAVEFSQALRWGLHWHCKGCRCCFGSGAPCCRLKEYKVSLFLGGSSDPLAGCSFGEISRPWDQQARTVAHFGKCQWILSLRSKLLNFVSQFNEPVGKMTSILMEPHVTVAGMQQRQFPRNPPSQQSIAWCTPKHTAEDQCNVQCRPYVNMLKMRWDTPRFSRHPASFGSGCEGLMASPRAAFEQAFKLCVLPILENGRCESRSRLLNDEFS